MRLFSKTQFVWSWLVQLFIQYWKLACAQVSADMLAKMASLRPFDPSTLRLFDRLRAGRLRAGLLSDRRIFSYLFLYGRFALLV